MKNSIFFRVGLLLTIILGLFSCKKEVLPTKKNGDIYVTINSYYPPIAGIDVFTVPATKQTVTDEFGTVLLSDVTPGTYEVYAKLTGYGSGKAAVKVFPDSLSRVTIFLQYAINASFSPEIEVILPSIPANFSPNENIVFSFNVTDSDSPAEEIDVVISSDLDGKLSEAHPNSENNVRFETSTLSRGIHTITITATDEGNNSTIRTISVSTTLPNNITLESADKTTQDYVLLKWQKYTDADFRRYEIYRTNNPDTEGELIASFTTTETIQYIDEHPPLVSEIYYYVRINNSDDQYRNSSKIKVEEPAGKIYNHSIYDAVHHPTEPILYIVDYDAMKLRAINYVTKTEINNISLDSYIGDIDIGDNGFGLELYVPNRSGFIHVYDANTLNLVTSILTGLDTRCVVTNGHGYLAASVVPSPWWEQPVRTYSRSTGLNISGDGEFSGDRLRFIPNTDKIISISTQVSPTDMEYFELNSSGQILLHLDDGYHGGPPLDPYIFRISSNGEFVITGEYGAVYSTSSTMTYKGMVDRGALYFSDFAFSNDGNTIYAGTSNRNSLQIIKYPQLTRSNEIITKGYPKFLFNFQGKIISISHTNTNQNAYTFEIISIE